jgi:hypothetical protein
MRAISHRVFTVFGVAPLKLNLAMKTATATHWDSTEKILFFVINPFFQMHETQKQRFV